MLTAILRKKNRITIPADIIKLTGLKENDPLEIEVIEHQDGYKIIIEPLKKHRITRRKRGLSLNALYKNFSIDNGLSEEVDWGNKVGDETW